MRSTTKPPIQPNNQLPCGTNCTHRNNGLRMDNHQRRQLYHVDQVSLVSVHATCKPALHIKSSGPRYTTSILQQHQHQQLRAHPYTLPRKAKDCPQSFNQSQTYLHSNNNNTSTYHKPPKQENKNVCVLKPKKGKETKNTKTE